MFSMKQIKGYALGAFLTVIITTVGDAQEQAAKPGQEPAAGGKAFDVSQVIAPRVLKMPKPKLRPQMVGEKLAVASPSSAAREHVKTGFALVHAQWDFEAYRHFCAALQEDPGCLMAYTGLSLSLAQSWHAEAKYRRAAVLRITDLLEGDEKRMKEGKEARFPAIERKFSAATAILLSASPQAAGLSFKSLGKEFPHFLQARLLGIFLTRGGYDVLGNPSEAQKIAVKDALELLAKHPENPLVIGFWLALNAEAPSAAINLKTDLLPYARKLAKQNPDVPSWQHFLGHFEWRAGNYLLAERAFRKSADLYAAWMKENSVSHNDCAGYFKAKCYLANSHYQRGDFVGAMKVAKELRAYKPDPKRPQSEGNQMLFWRAYTLPARLYMAHGADGDMNRAQKSLPTVEEMKPFTANRKFPTLAGAYVDALRTYTGVRKAIDDKAHTAATSLHKKTFRRYIASMARVSKGASRAADYSHFLRAGSSLAIYDMELAGLVSLCGPRDLRLAAANWFRSARDKQIIPSQMMPPAIPNPMENRLGDYYRLKGDYKSAYDAYAAGNSRYPNNMQSLKMMLMCLEKQGKKDQAAVIKKHIELIKPK